MLTCRFPLQSIAVFMIFLCGMMCPKEARGLTWQMPPVDFANTIDASDLAADPLGNAFTAWSDSGNLFVSRFSNTTASYGPFVPISADGQVFSLAIATDASQTALLIWADDSLNQILTSFYNGTTWVTPLPSPLDAFPLGGFLTTVDVSMDGSGNGLATWQRIPGTPPPGDIVVSFFNGGTQSWGPLTVVGTGNAPQVAYSSSGKAAVIWSDAANNLLASYFNGTSWTVVPPVIAPNADFQSYTVEIDAAGHALASYVDATTSDFFAVYYNGTAWGAPVNLSGGATTAFSSTLARSGTGFAAWADTSGNGFYSEFTGGAWSAPLPFATNVENFSIAVAVDSSGNALITWQDSVTNAGVSILKPLGGALGAPSNITVPPASLSPQLAALADNGRGFVIGSNNVAENSGLSGSFTLDVIPPLDPALSISGAVCTNKFASQKDRVHIITWIPSSNVGVTSYLLTRNGVLIAQIPAAGPFTYYDHNRCREADIYTITPVAADGTPLAAPASVILQ